MTYIDTELNGLVGAAMEDAKPTAGFQRVVQRAVIHVQSSGREEVTGANVMVALLSERESHAVYFLQEQEMTRSEEHTSELQSLMRISYAVFCLNKKKTYNNQNTN